MPTIDEFLSASNNLIWYIAFAILVPLAVYFTIRFRCLQLRKADEACRLATDITSADTEGQKKISAFESFLMSLGARVGVGNIAGVASAIMLGGPGAIFWMWIFAIIISILGFAEATAAQMYKERNDSGIYSGGPPFYAKKALGNHRLALVMAVLLIALYGVGLMMVNASISMDQIASASPNDTVTGIIAIGFIAFVSAVIIGGIKRVANACAVLVPLMLFMWVIICAITLMVNWQNIGNAFYMIFHYAFVIPDGLAEHGFLSVEGLWEGFRGPIGGLIGTIIAVGLRKGVFSNEAGVGSISVLSGSAECTHPVKLGYLQTLAVLIDTLVVCTLTAITVLSFGDFQALMDTGLDDAPLVSLVISKAFLGDAAGLVLSILLFICALSSIISFYGIVETTSAYISRRKEFLNILKVVIIVSLFIGCVMNIRSAYAVTEILMAACAIPHVIILFRLRKNIMAAYRDYHSQKDAGVKEPRFHKDAVPDKEGITEWD